MPMVPIKKRRNVGEYHAFSHVHVKDIKEHNYIYKAILVIIEEMIEKKL